jgi:hypothetical protein
MDLMATTRGGEPTHVGVGVGVIPHQAGMAVGGPMQPAGGPMQPAAQMHGYSMGGSPRPAQQPAGGWGPAGA